MTLDRLPTELLWKIADDLPTCRTECDFSQVSKTLYARLNHRCYQRAVSYGIPLLAIACDFSASSEGPVAAAKKYLEAGGGSLWWDETDGSESSASGLDDVFHDNFDNYSRCGRTWWPQWIYRGAASTRFFDVNIQSEIGRVICIIMKPESFPVDHLEQRLTWVRLIMRTALPEILLKVEWRPVLSWLCRTFDEKSTSSFEFLDTIMEELDSLAQRTSSTGRPVLPFARHGDSGGVTVRIGVDEVANTGPAEDLVDFQRIWKDSAWDDPYTVQSPFTHLFLCARILRGHDDPSTESYPRRIQFLHHLLDCGAVAIDDHTLWFLIGWHSEQRKHQLAFPIESPQLPDKDFEELLETSCRIRINSTGLGPVGTTDWVTKALLPFALEVNHEVAVRQLLAMGAKPNERDDQGRTPVMRTDDPDVFQVVLSQETTDLDARDNSGHTNILTSLVLRGLSLHDEQDLRKDRQKLREKDKLDTKLNQVVEQMKLVLERSRSDIVNCPGEQGGMPPLALAMGCITLAQLPTSYMNRIGRAGTTQLTPWLVGAKMLLEAGANPNVQVPMPTNSGTYDTWLLHRTILRTTREAAAVDLLLDHGVDITNRDRSGRTVADLGNIQESAKLGELMLSAGLVTKKTTVKERRNQRST